MMKGAPNEYKTRDDCVGRGIHWKLNFELDLSRLFYSLSKSEFIVARIYNHNVFFFLLSEKYTEKSQHNPFNDIFWTDTKY